MPVQSERWCASAVERIVAGKAPHLESHIFQVLMPKTTHMDIAHHTKPDLSKLSLPITPSEL